MDQIEEWRCIDKNNVMLGFILDKKEELTEELVEYFKERFKEKFGFEPEKIEVGPPERHVWVGNWKGNEND